MLNRPYVLRVYQVAGFDLIQVKVTHCTLDGEACVLMEDATSASGSRLTANFEHAATSYRVELMTKGLHPWKRTMQFVQTRRVQGPAATLERAYEKVSMHFDSARYGRGRWEPVAASRLRFSAAEATAGWWPTSQLR